MKTQQVEYLTVYRAESRQAMGRAGAADAAAYIQRLLERKARVSVVFAAAPSQNEFLEGLVGSGLDFSRIHAYHMDEYLGLAPDAPQGFGNFLRRALFGRAAFGAVDYLNGQAEDPEAECRRYAALLQADPPDVVCMGIGENGHIAFNDPAEADFDDPAQVKVVTLDEQCRMQQVHDGCFDRLEAVPRQALTLTIPALTAGTRIFCVVPAATKAQAVRDALLGPVSEACPASILRRCPEARLYLDPDSAALWERDHG